MFPKDVDEEPYQRPFVMDVALYLSTPAAMAVFFALFWVAGSGAQDGLGAGAFVQGLTGVDVLAARNATPWYHYVLMILLINTRITATNGCNLIAALKAIQCQLSTDKACSAGD